MRLRNVILVGVALVLAGCWQKSLHPFYTANDVTEESALAGAWQEVRENGKESDDLQVWTFTRAAGSGFTLVMSNKNERYEYDAQPFKLGERRFFDTFSRERAVGTIPAHHLFQIISTETNLVLKALNINWVERWVKKHPGTLAHIVVPNPEHPNDREKDEIVITADTKTLQNFVRDHVGDREFMTGELVLARMGGKAPTKQP